jgi:imidazolonepropionase-like amidohydrolase
MINSSKMKRTLLNFLLFCIAQSALSQSQENRYTLVISNANIVDIIGNKIIANRLLAISGDTIKAIDDTKKLKQYKAARYVNAAGKYMIPGLWDMHVHFRGGDSLIDANKALLPLFLAYGVTTVRDCGGDITPSVMEWRNQITQGTLAGPGIFTSGPKIDGPSATWAGSLEVETPEQVSKALDSLQNLHVDFVKIYESKISRDAYLQTIAQAEKRGMKTSGHMPYTVKITEAVDRGLDASEHMYYVFKGCSSKEDSITALIQAREHTNNPIGLFAALPGIYESYNEAKAAQLFKYLAQKKFTVLPTLFISKTLGGLKENDHATDSLRHYIDPKIRATYEGRFKSAKRQSEAATLLLKKYEIKCHTMIPQMYAAGINIMAGSDCGAFNSFVYPGESLHEEVKLLAASGLTPSQALQTATINGAKFMGVSNFHGTIEKGKSADMVMLETNPLINISAIDRISMVLSNGKLYTKDDLNNLLRSIRH